MKKLNNYICWGLLLNAIWIFSNRFNLLPDFFEGLSVGLGVLFIFIGMYSEKYNMSKVEDYKKKAI
ncbi:hypothetical protein [Clostridium sp.]|uniref:hypothetical protein n=1 Tax=Clostridium sp. TaxID=1506 RepID=UPI002619FC99|nr:hypothetical protein [Clostridium sp.]